MQETPPGPLSEVARLLGAAAPERRDQGFAVPGGEWTIEPAFRGFSDPPPAKAYCLGKQSSCLRDGSGRISCAEVEITKRLRRSGWRGGWINTYGGDPPTRWLRWTTTVADVVGRLPRHRTAFGAWLTERIATRAGSAGIPDLVVVRGDAVLVLECKRQRDADSRGDAPKVSQVHWATAVVRDLGLLDPAEFAVIWWTRAPAPRTSPAVRPEDEPTQRILMGGRSGREVGAIGDRRPSPERRRRRGSSQ